ncbi:hypothetical protein ACFQV2_13665 [Actinokineospora soli]|uniref:Uncharacterized protein n=1 Tax=Actinokineospora soli TaxID=1048753 RepID=A0ABW2TMN6_9PSEU
MRRTLGVVALLLVACAPTGGREPFPTDDRASTYGQARPTTPRSSTSPTSSGSRAGRARSARRAPMVWCGHSIRTPPVSTGWPSARSPS